MKNMELVELINEINTKNEAKFNLIGEVQQLERDREAQAIQQLSEALYDI